MTQVMLKAPPPMPAPPPAGPRLAPGAHLFLEGAETENLYFFVRGWAMKYKSLLDGRRQILDFVLPGELLGFVAA